MELGVENFCLCKLQSIRRVYIAMFIEGQILFFKQ
jgi:hypothetical protein